MSTDSKPNATAVSQLITVAKTLLEEADQGGGRVRTVTRYSVDNLRAALQSVTQPAQNPTTEQPFTVILGGTDEDDSLTAHHVMAINPDAAIFVACEEAEITWACDAIVLAGHHNDLRKERGAVRVEE